MNLKALHRPHRRGQATIQLTDTRRSRREPARVARDTGAARLTSRWTVGADGRPVLVWSLDERPTRNLINRKRGSDA